MAEEGSAAVRTRRRSSLAALEIQAPAPAVDYPTPESITDLAEDSSDTTEDSVVDEGSAVPRRRKLRARAPPTSDLAKLPSRLPLPSRPSRATSKLPAAGSRVSSRISVTRAQDLDEVAPIVEVEDENGIETLEASGRSIGHEQRQKRLLSKRLALKGGKITKKAVTRPVRMAPQAVPAKKAVKPRSTSNFAAAAVEIYKPKERTFQIRHYRTNQPGPAIMDIDEITRLISPLPSPSPSPPPDGAFEASGALASTDPRRHCTHLRKCFNEATLIEFDKRGFVSSPPAAREIFREEGLRCIRWVYSSGYVAM
jgi:hypothetical protein